MKFTSFILISFRYSQVTIKEIVPTIQMANALDLSLMKANLVYGGLNLYLLILMHKKLNLILMHIRRDHNNFKHDNSSKY